MRWATLTLLAALAAAPGVADERGPNVVLLIGDDVGYPYFGFMGDDNVVTPASDALATGGYTFTQGHVTAPYCRPSLRTLITGLHPVQYSLRLDALIEERKLEAGFESMDEQRRVRWLTVERAAGMARFATLPALLRGQGYVSWQGGKWWEGSHRNGHFDEGMTRGWDMSLFGKDGFFEETMGNEGNRLVRETMQPLFDFIERNHEQPLFIWFGPQLPHTPFDAPFKYRKYYANEDLSESAKLYYANVSWWDDGVGRLVDFIEGQGLYSDTLFVYVGDNGWEQDANVEYKKPNSTLRNDSLFATGGMKGKGGLYDLSVRSPIIFHWHGRLEPDFNESSLVSSMDIVPTVLDFAGAEIPEGLPGRSLRPLLERTGPIDERTALIGYSDNRRSLTNVMGEPAEGYYVRTHRWHFIHYADTGETILYDVTVDPRGSSNLGGTRPDLVERFKSMIEDWKGEMGMTDRIPIH